MHRLSKSFLQLKERVEMRQIQKLGEHHRIHKLRLKLNQALLPVLRLLHNIPDVVEKSEPKELIEVP
jgi:hypothetical protein